MDWISTYDSSSRVSLGTIREDDNRTKWWLLCVTDTMYSFSFHFSISRFSTLIMLSLQIPKNLIDIISLSHNLGWLFVYKIWLFKYLWRLRFATCRFNCSTNVITGILFSIACFKKHPFSTNTKIIFMGTQIHKVLVVFVLSSTTVREVN